MHARTTAIPAMPKERIVAPGNTKRLDNAAATVAAENNTVRPLVAMVRRTASCVSKPAPRSSRKRLIMSSP